MEQVHDKPIIMTPKRKGKRSPKKGELIVMERKDVHVETRGRPSTYTQEMADKICDLIAAGTSLRKIGRMEGMPPATTICSWLLNTDDPEKQTFFVQYTRACNIRAELIFDELLEISDDGTNDWMTVEKQNGDSYEILNKEAVMRSRLRVDVRRWYLSKVMPKKYGDKLDVTTGGDKLQNNSITFVNFSVENKEENGSES